MASVRTAGTSSSLFLLATLPSYYWPSPPSFLPSSETSKPRSSMEDDAVKDASRTLNRTLHRTEGEVMKDASHAPGNPYRTLHSKEENTIRKPAPPRATPT